MPSEHDNPDDSIQPASEPASAAGNSHQELFAEFLANSEFTKWQENIRSELSKSLAGLAASLEPYRAQVQKMMASLGPLLEKFIEEIPENLRGLKMEQIVQLYECAEDGIPVVFIPRRSVLELLLNCRDYESRVAVLTQHRDEVLDDCESAILELDSQQLFPDQMPLFTAVFGSVRAGFDAPAQALAINLTDRMGWTFFQPNGRGTIFYKAKMAARRIVDAKSQDDFTEIDVRDFFFGLAVVVLSSEAWSADWDPSDSIPTPTKLTRHGASHHPSIQLYREEHAIIAIMVMTSIAVLASRKTNSDYQGFVERLGTTRP